MDFVLILLTQNQGEWILLAHPRAGRNVYLLQRASFTVLVGAAVPSRGLECNTTAKE